MHIFVDTKDLSSVVINIYNFLLLSIFNTLIFLLYYISHFLCFIIVLLTIRFEFLVPLIILGLLCRIRSPLATWTYLALEMWLVWLRNWIDLDLNLKLILDSVNWKTYMFRAVWICDSPLTVNLMKSNYRSITSDRNLGFELNCAIRCTVDFKDLI